MKEETAETKILKSRSQYKTITPCKQKIDNAAKERKNVEIIDSRKLFGIIILKVIKKITDD